VEGATEEEESRMNSIRPLRGVGCGVRNGKWDSFSPSPYRRYSASSRLRSKVFLVQARLMVPSGAAGGYCTV